MSQMLRLRRISTFSSPTPHLRVTPKGRMSAIRLRLGREEKPGNPLRKLETLRTHPAESTWVTRPIPLLELEKLSANYNPNCRGRRRTLSAIQLRMTITYDSAATPL